MDLSRLSEPFSADDIEWRVSRAGTGSRGVWCKVLAYITARGVQSRLDEVCGPENWRVEHPTLLQLASPAFAVGVSIRINDEWVTKWDVSELPTSRNPKDPLDVAKSGMSMALKRSGAMWGIGRYLYHLPEQYAEVQETDPGVRGWHWAKVSKDGPVYYWKEPTLPSWALPKDDCEVSAAELQGLKQDWRHKYMPDSRNPSELAGGFQSFVRGVCGEFPVADHTTWTADALRKCREQLGRTNSTDGVAEDVPFEE